MAACTVHNAGERYATEYMDEADNVPDSIPCGAAHGVSRDAGGGAGATRHLSVLKEELGRTPLCASLRTLPVTYGMMRSPMRTEVESETGRT